MRMCLALAACALHVDPGWQRWQPVLRGSFRAADRLKSRVRHTVWNGGSDRDIRERMIFLTMSESSHPAVFAIHLSHSRKSNVPRA
jgi:hypothetical protein